MANIGNKRGLDMAVGTELKVARIRKGETLRGIAERAGIDPGYLSKIENNKSKVPADVLKRLCEALEVSADAILELPPHKQQAGEGTAHV
jgi:transcriptional regulator with XRE-family HTH domain